MNDSRGEDVNHMPASELELIRARQRARARVMALLLGGFVVLVFAISIVKMQLGHGG
ncbi:hypothetical protein [Sphingomonas sp. 22176]|uniref:hypothetical protein n=1 Tax=Sphingomonas sp. 22176 TaxID=3453884 RepID=UPI003F83F0A1